MKKTIRICIDIIMTITTLLLMSLATTGIALHEVLGVVVFLLYLFHKIVNRAWIRSIARLVFKGPRIVRIHMKTRVMILLDTVLLFTVTIATGTGISISQSLFPFFSTWNNDLVFWSAAHLSASYSSLILISIHIGFHWKSLMMSFKRLVNLQTESKARTMIARVLASLLVLAGIRYSLSKQIGTVILTPFALSKNEENVKLTQTVTKSVENHSYASTGATTTDTETLEEFLGKMFCTLCGKHCSLLRLRCSRGTRKLNEAKVQYEAMVKANTSSQAPETSNEEGSSLLEENPDSDSPFTNIPIMSVYIAGSHYLVSLSKQKKKQEDADVSGTA